MVFDRGTADERRRGKVRPQPVDGAGGGVVEGPLAGTAWIRTAPPAPGSGGDTIAMPRSAPSTAAVSALSERGAVTCSVPGAPGPKAALICS